MTHDATLIVADTHERQDALDGTVPAGAWFAYDGTTIFSASRRGFGGSITRARTVDDALLDRMDFYRGRPEHVYPVFDGTSVYVVTNQPTDVGTRSTMHFLGFNLTALTDPVPLCDSAALGLATTKLAEDLFVLCQGDTLVELDRTLRTRVRVADVASGDSTGTSCGAADISMSSTGTVLFVLCSASGTLLYLDHLTLEPIRSLPVGAGGARMARAPNGQYVIVIRPEAREVVVLDVRRRVVTGRATTSQPPRAVAADSDSRSAFVATGIEGAAGTLLKIDLASGTVRAEAPTAAMPISVSVWPGEESPVMRWEVRGD